MRRNKTRQLYSTAFSLAHGNRRNYSAQTTEETEKKLAKECKKVKKLQTVQCSLHYLISPYSVCKDYLSIIYLIVLLLEVPMTRSVVRRSFLRSFGWSMDWSVGWSVFHNLYWKLHYSMLLSEHFFTALSLMYANSILVLTAI